MCRIEGGGTDSLLSFFGIFLLPATLNRFATEVAFLDDGAENLGLLAKRIMLDSLV